jgi:hypothetical protein
MRVTSLRGALALWMGLTLLAGCGDTATGLAVDAAAPSADAADGGDVHFCEEGLWCDGTCSECPADPGIAVLGCEASRCVATACATGYHTCGESCCAWQSREIRPGEHSGPSASFGPDGVLHLLARDVNDDNLVYGRLEGGVWSFEESLDPDGLAGLYAAIAVAADGTPHIAYLRDVDEQEGFGETELRYARRGAGGWEIETIDEGEQVGWHVSIALGPAGDPHVAYRRPGALVYARLAGDSWPQDEVFDEQLPQQLELAIDGAGAAHLAFTAADGRVRYAVRETDSWTVEVAYDERDTFYVSLAAGPGGTHVIHAEGSGVPPLSLRHSKRVDTGWETVLLDQGPGTLNWSPSVTMDARGHLHAAFGVGEPALRYARFTGLGWLRQEIDGGFSTRIIRPAIAVHDHHAHIVYLRDGALAHAF